MVRRVGAGRLRLDRTRPHRNSVAAFRSRNLERKAHSIRALKFSIIIVTYQRHGPLSATLRELGPALPARGCSDGEILVIDQKPKLPLSPELLRIPGLRYIVLDRPGMVNARNAGILQSRGDILIFLDDDVIPSPGLVSGHLGAYLDVSIGGVAGRILDPGQNEFPTPHPRMFDLEEGWEYAHFDHDVAGDVMTSRGCNMSFRRSVLVEIGGFDPFLEIFRDDTDACLRVMDAGFRVRFVPEACLVHVNAPSGGTRGAEAEARSAWSREMAMYRQHYRHYRDNLYFLLRHFRGERQRRYLRQAYRGYVGFSRLPWRLLAKNACFVAALGAASRRTRERRDHPCRLSPGP